MTETSNQSGTVDSSADTPCYTVLDLFSGIGGFTLGLERAGGFRTVAFCEIEKFPKKVLKKHWPDVPIFEDVRTLHAADLPEPVNVICGGYPCQPFSLAGKRGGKEDDRHLWPEMFRLIRECRPTWVIAENVAGHVSMGLDQVLVDLESEDYSCWPFIIPACAVDAPHRRDRVWIVANSECNGWHQRSKQTGWSERNEVDRHGGQAQALMANPESKTKWAGFCEAETQQDRNKPGNSSGVVSDTTITGLEDRISCPKRQGPGREFKRQGGHRGLWPAEPAVGRVANGVPRRVDRLKGLGNAVVPLIPEIIGRAILSV